MEQALGTRSSDAPRYSLSGGRVGAAPPQPSQPLLGGRHVGKAAVSQQATPPHRKEGNSRGQPQSPAEEPLFTFILLLPVFYKVVPLNTGTAVHMLLPLLSK